MAEYTRAIRADANLDKITNMVRGEEAGASRFLRNTIAVHQGKMTNLAVFEELDPGTVPADIVFLASDAPTPNGYVLYWEGVMIVSGTNTVVKAYRKATPA